MYYIYEKSSTLIIGKPDRFGIARPDHRQSYKTMAAAKAAITRMTKLWRANTLSNYEPVDNDPVFRYGIAEANYFHKTIERKVAKRNLSTGIVYEETVNTPAHMSPACETYWSM
jgi:hypothetical protein